MQHRQEPIRFSLKYTLLHGSDAKHTASHKDLKWQERVVQQMVGLPQSANLNISGSGWDYTKSSEEVWKVHHDAQQQTFQEKTVRKYTRSH